MLYLFNFTCEIEDPQIDLWKCVLFLQLSLRCPYFPIFERFDLSQDLTFVVSVVWRVDLFVNWFVEIFFLECIFFFLPSGKTFRNPYYKAEIRFNMFLFTRVGHFFTEYFSFLELDCLMRRLKKCSGFFIHERNFQNTTELSHVN